MKTNRYVAEAVFLLTAVFYGVRCLKFLNDTKEPYLEILTDDVELTIPSTEPFSIACSLNGPDHTARMAWIDPRGRVVPDWLDIHYLTVVTRGYSTLMLRMFNPERGQSGTYTCSAEYNNTLVATDLIGTGKFQVSVNITVLDKPRISKFENVTMEEGRRAVLVCNAESHPTPNITIEKAGDPYFAEKDPRIQVEYFPESDRNSVKVIINEVMRGDEGSYYCLAEANGYNDNRTAYLEVQFAPNLTATAPKQLLSRSGNFTNLTCIAEGNPSPVISWEYENMEIDPENQDNITYGHRVISHLSIYINDTTDAHSNVYGIYKCIATNLLGSRSVNITLQEADVPGEITEVLIDRATPRSIFFRFLGPLNDGGKPVIAYVVNYSSTEYFHNSLIEWPVASSYVLENLQPGARYIFKLAAKNSVGIGAWKTMHFTMPKDVNDTITEPNTLITKNVNITDYPDRYEIRWKVHDEYGMLKRYFVVTYFNDGQIKVEHQNGNITFPL